MTDIQKKIKTKEDLFQISSLIRKMVSETDNEQLKRDMIRVMFDMKLAIDNYLAGDIKNISNRKLMEAKNMLEQVNHIIDDLVMNSLETNHKED